MTRLSISALLLVAVAACTSTPAVNAPAAQIRDTTPVSGSLISARAGSAMEETRFTPWGQNGDTETWLGENRISLSFQDGILVSTRGLADDLMSSDASATRIALQGGLRENYTRFASYLDGQGDTLFRSMVCSMDGGSRTQIEISGNSVQTLMYEETCNSLTTQMTNTFWVGEDGTMWQSQQWIGDNTGYLFATRLIK